MLLYIRSYVLGQGTFIHGFVTIRLHVRPQLCSKQKYRRTTIAERSKVKHNLHALI